jgi:hypothetical protein
VPRQAEAVMRSPIDMLLDKIDWKCAQCGVSTKTGCDCWVTLHCPDCGRTKLTLREKDDPPSRRTVDLRCDKCWT